MSKKVLIFGLGKQGTKYYKYFKKKNYSICGVNESGINKQGLDLHSIYSFNSLIDSNKLNYSNFDFIIIAVFSYIKQDIVLKYLLQFEIKTNIIIEKPVSRNIELLSLLNKRDNFHFFIDEIMFFRQFHNIKNISNINIELNNFDKDLLEHILGFFLLRGDFYKLLNKVNIKNHTSNLNGFSFNLDIFSLESDINIICDKGKCNYNIMYNFDNSLDFLLLKIIKNKVNKIYKNNFLIMQKFLGKMK